MTDRPEEDLDRIISFLNDETKKRRWRIRILRDGYRRQGEYLSLRTAMPLKDAWEKAKRLQELEDTWNKSAARKPRITLIPASTPE